MKFYLVTPTNTIDVSSSVTTGSLVLAVNVRKRPPTVKLLSQKSLQTIFCLTDLLSVILSKHNLHVSIGNDLDVFF